MIGSKVQIVTLRVAAVAAAAVVAGIGTGSGVAVAADGHGNSPDTFCFAAVDGSSVVAPSAVCYW